MWKSKVADQTAAGLVAVKKQSKVPGVMITQFVEELPAGRSTPDFVRKPIALTIQEGKTVQFKAVVCGNPKPEVIWKRAKGEISDEQKFRAIYDESSEEYILEIMSVSGKEGDIYKCFAINEFGKAVCTAALNVIEVGFNKEKEMEGPVLTADLAEFRKMLRKSSGREEKVEKEKKEEVIDDKFWEILLSAEKKDYERICAEYGVTDFRWMLKKLTILKKEREEEQCLYLNVISNLRHIEMKGDGSATFEMMLDLKDPSSRIFLYKDGVMIPYSEDMEMKHQLKKIGKKLIFTIKDLAPEDAGLYQVDVEEVNVFATDLKVPMVDFIVKIQEVNAKEREDAIFECVLSQPFSKILWKGKNSPLEDGEKFEITVSEDKLIHRLLVKDCKLVDKGIYSAVAGLKSCSAWLRVEADTQPHKKKVRKTTQSGGAGVDLSKVVQEHQAKLQKEKEDKLDAMMKETEGNATGNIMSGLGNSSEINFGIGDGLDDSLVQRKGAGMDSGSGCNEDGGFGDDKSGDIIEPNAQNGQTGNGGLADRKRCGRLLPNRVVGQRNMDAATADSELENDKESRQVSHKENERGKWQGNKQESVQGNKQESVQGNRQENVQGYNQNQKNEQGNKQKNEQGNNQNNEQGNRQENKQRNRQENGQESSGSGDWPAEHTRQGLMILDKVTDPGLQFISGLSDIKAKAGQPAEMVCKLSHENGNGAWFKDGDILSPREGLSLSKDGACHKLKIDSCLPDDTGKYSFEADGCKTEAMIIVEDPGVQFISGLSDINAKAGQLAEMVCKLSDENCNGAWFKDGNTLLPRDGLSLSKAGACHKLRIDSCRPDDTGKYSFEADGRKTEAMIIVEGPGVQFINGLSDIKAQVGQPAEMVCKLSNENCSGTWFKDGNTLSPREGLSLSKAGACHKLRIDSCRPDDTGKYSFEADGCKTEAMIIVEDPGIQFVSGLSDINAEAGQPAELVCKLRNENSNGEWFKDGKNLSPREGLSLSKDGAHHKLRIDSCQQDDTGKYSFEADGCKTEAKITVRDPQNHFIIGLSDIYAKTGQPAELVCKLKENCNGAWFKDEEKLSPRDGLSLSKDGACHKLRIKSCQADDTGKYRFEAGGHKTEARITVEYTDPRDHSIIGLSDIHAKTGQPTELSAQYPRDHSIIGLSDIHAKTGQPTELSAQYPEDHFIIGLSDILAKAGQPAELICKLKESCEGEWFKDGKKLSPRDGLSLSEDGACHKLKIDSCQVEDTGKYCFEADECKTEAKITVEDLGIQFISGLSDINVKAGQPAELVCRLNKENCNGTWLKDGKRLLTRDGLILSKDGACHKLNIYSCCANDIGNYRFEVERCKTEAMIIVEDAGLQFIRGLSDLIAKTGQPAELVCKLNNENCNGTWFKDGNKLSPRDGLSLSKDGACHKLKINSCRADDTGKYFFEAEGLKTEAKITVEGPGVEVISGLSDIKANAGQPAEMVCRLSDENSNGVWFKDGKKLSSRDGLSLSKDGACHKLKIDSCHADDTGKYRFEADGRKTEAMIIVEDPPKFSKDALDTFSKPVIVKAGQNATFKMPFVGGEPKKVQWYKEGEELLANTNIKLDIMAAHSCLLLSSCQREDTGEIKIKVKNDFGTIEAVSGLVVLDKPSPPQGPVEVEENSASCINIKWKPPKDDGGAQLQEYALERQQVGRNTWTKLGQVPSATTTYKDTSVEHGRKYCYRIRAVNEEGVSEPMETEDIMAGIKAYPGPPGTPKVLSAFNDCINLTWAAPAKTAGSPILGYYLEKRKRGSNMWSPVNPQDEPIQDRKYTVKDVIVGMAYEFRVSAVNVSGLGEPSMPTDFVIARNPKKPPGRVTDLKVTDSTNTTLSLAWTEPTEEGGVQDEAKGYFVEIRPVESQDWIRCNTNPVILTTFTVKGLKSMAIYWVRVIAMNDGGEGVPQDLDNYITAMSPPVRPRFTDTKMKSFMVVRAGNAVRISINFQASPWPEVIWLKDNMSVSKRVTISNTEGMSQLLIPSSERSDTGVYTITIKNMVGQETFSVEIRVTDDPKPPGPVELQTNVPGTVTVAWKPSPDEKRDDRLHYMVSMRDSTKQTWLTVADHIFNNKFTACNIVPGHEYHFRIYAKNDIGMSEPSESPTWGTTRIRDKFVVNTPEFRPCNLESAPTFLVPLKLHMAPKGYECYMSCAVTGNPRPHVTWYHNNLSINTNTNYYISNTCGVCSMLILRVGPNDQGEYTVIAENSLGRAECSTKLTIRE